MADIAKIESFQSLDELVLPSINKRDSTASPAVSTQWIGSEDFYDFTSSRENSSNYAGGKILPEIQIKSSTRSSIDFSPSANDDEELPLPQGMCSQPMKVSSALRRPATGSFLAQQGMFRGSIAEEDCSDDDRHSDEHNNEDDDAAAIAALEKKLQGSRVRTSTFDGEAEEREREEEEERERERERLRLKEKKKKMPSSFSSSSFSPPSVALTEVRPGGTNQDYLALARLYKVQRPYCDPSYQALCLLCQRNYCEDVFFPCEHHCVCRKCIRREHICEEGELRKDPKGYCHCSLCAGVIKRILPLEGGLEVKKYWDWVYEEKVQLPIGFMRNWRHSGAVIKKIYIDERYENSGAEGTSSFCAIS